MKKLLFFALIAFLSSCTISETIVLNKDLSGRKVIEFELQSSGGNPMGEALEEAKQELENEDMTDEERTKAEMGMWLLENYSDSAEDLKKIDKLFGLIENINNYSIDTFGQKYLQIAYDFSNEDLKIKDQAAYDAYVAELSDNVRWYFRYHPNRFEQLDENKVLWRILDVDLFNMPYKDYLQFSSDLGTASMIITIKFERAMKSVSAENILLSPDKKILKCKIDLSEVKDLKQNNEIVIEFE